MTKFFILASMLFSINATANTLQITSFKETAPGTRVAELCVRVTGDLGPIEIIDITADPGRHQAHYTGVLGPDGKLCSVFHSVFGKAEVRLRRDMTQVKSVNLE